MRMFALVLVIAACGGDAATADSVVVRDSAGITIVENGADGGDPAWAAVRALPDLEIGGGDGATGVQFGQIVDLAVDADGGIYVLDGVERSIAVFAADGTPIRTIGRGGEGPGEFSRYVNGLIVRGDTLLVPDWANRRMSRFALDGTLLATEELGAAGARSAWQQAADGTLRARLLRMRVDSATGLWTSDDVLVAAAAGAPLDTVLSFDYARTDIGGPQAVRAPLIVNAPSWSVLPGGAIAWTALDLAELRLHSSDGTRVRVIRHHEWVKRTATPADREHMVSLLGERLARLGGDPAAIAQLDIPPVGELPVLTSVRPGPRGTLWVQRAGEPRAYHSMSINAAEFPHGLGGPVWDVLDADGRYLATLTLPDSIQVVRIEDDALYGVRRDALGVESVVRLRLEGVPAPSG